jgi:hypothetical protein
MTFLSLKSRASYQYLRARQWRGGEMANMRGVTTALILLACCAAAPSPAAPGASDQRIPADSISFEISSWGYPIESFRIASDGSGEYRKAPEFRAEVQVHRFNAGPAGFAQIRDALAGVERFTVQPPACGSRATDMPYGRIAWHAGSTEAAVGLDLGCQDQEMTVVVIAANAAARIAEQLSQANGAR